MDFGKQVLLWFASGLFIAAGSKVAEYLATQLSATRARGGSQSFGSASLALCPTCGRNLRRFAKSLYCAQCGHREG
jgi:hypothetical protein